MVAPTEAEAQCAALNEMELTHGTITDDNDVFLFGGRKVYRHFFSQDRELEVYTSSDLQQRLGKYVYILRRKYSPSSPPHSQRKLLYSYRYYGLTYTHNFQGYVYLSQWLALFHL